MLVFPVRGASQIRYRADFTHIPYANISFFDADRRIILFHLSLRRDEGLAACNRRGRGVNDWGREIRRQVVLPEAGVDVEIRFDPPRLRILLDGREIFGFGTRLGRPRFPGLSGISSADWQGGIHAGSIDAGPEPEAALMLTPRLELRGRVPLRADAAALRLEIPGTDGPPELVASRGRRDEHLLRAVLPGRIWRGAGTEGSVKISLYEGERHIFLLELERRDLVEHIASALATTGLEEDFFLTTQILEHLRHSGLTAALDGHARRQLAAIANRLGLGDDIDFGDTGMRREAPLPADAEHPLHEALAAVSRTLRGFPDGSGAVSALTGLTPPRDEEELFYVALAEPFCQIGAFDLLYDHVRDTRPRLRFDPGDGAWHNSGLLPYLWRSGRTGELVKTLLQLVEDSGQWIMTPPLGWTVRAALSDATLDAETREDIISAYLAFLDRRMWDYWQRTPCTQLVETAVAVLADAPRQSAHLQAGAEATLLSSYGLSPDFWARMEKREVKLTPRIAAAGAAFRSLRDPEASPAVRQAALSLFDRFNCADRWRVRRDLFGPAGRARARPATGLALFQANDDPADAAIRLLAAPDAPEANPDIAELARRALPDRYPDVPRAPHPGLQTDICRRANAVLAEAGKGGDPVEPCRALLPDLELLSDNRSHHVGTGLALSLLRGLIALRAEKSATLLGEWQIQSLKRRFWGVSDPAPLSAHAAVAMALDALATPVLAENAAIGEIRAAIPAAPAPLPRPRAEHIWAASRTVNPLFDTVVLVFSCRAHLDTRIPQMRDGWLADLESLGVPYLIVTGDGDNTVSGDVLHLAAPDDYEGLPQKTLTAIRWVLGNTDFAHLVKVDDDCFLNVDEYFHSLSYRKFDYYGRVLTRVPGQMDRAWHCAKSTSARGRLEFDKSPEPSAYCDGGSGYALSRRAMAAALTAADSPPGRMLIQVSFMEDKLLGDLLALQGIAPQGEDYHIAIRRRECPGGLPVPRWVNGFDASATAPVKLVHLDDPGAQATARRRLATPGLWPRKIWPSYQDVTLGEQSNALEMVTGPDRLEAARTAPVAVVATMRNEMFMLPHFLAHYRHLGVDSFVIADNCSSDGTLEYLAEQPDVTLFSVDTDYRHSHYGVAWQQALMANIRPNRWSLVADADELLTWQYPQDQTLPDLLASPGLAKADAVRIFMLDLYPRGPLAGATYQSGSPFAEAGFTDRDPLLLDSFGRGPYSNAPTWTSAVRHRLIPGSRNELFVAQKIALLKYTPFLRLSDGLHYIAGARLADRELFFGHFKYNADFHRKARTEVARRQHFNDAEEYAKYLALASEGRDVMFDPDISVPWMESAFVRERLF